MSDRRYLLAAALLSSSLIVYGAGALSPALADSDQPVSEPETSGQEAPNQDAYAGLPDPAAADFLAGLGERAIADLTDSGLSAEARDERFRKLFADSFDLQAIGRFVLGPHWRRASPAERQDFLSVFEDAIVQRFLPMFEDYSGETFQIDRTRRDENNPSHVFVVTRIEQSSGQLAEVEWRLRQRDGGYRILDVNAEGVSMAITLRQEYGSVLKQSGVEGLVKLLRRKVEAGDFAPKKTAAQ